MDNKKINDSNVNSRTSDYVCFDCGVKFLPEERKRQEHISTYNRGECGLCGEVKSVTHIRAFNYLKSKK